MRRGVPQGSCLGPLLFLIYVNDLHTIPTHGKAYLFADDTAIFYSSPSFDVNVSEAESDLVRINGYFQSIGLKPNPSKTKAMHFYTTRSNLMLVPPSNLKLNDEPIETVTRFKYLGLTLDSNLSWSEHINDLHRRIKPIVALMHKAKSLLPKDMRRIVYHSMINSQLTYMVELWGTSSKTNLKPLQTLQNRAIRNVCELPYLTPRTQLYSSQYMHVLPLQGIFELAIATFVFKTLKKINHCEVSFSTTDHNYHSRYRHLLRPPRCNLEFAKRRIAYQGPLIYNSLQDCQDARIIVTFRRKARGQLQSRLPDYF